MKRRDFVKSIGLCGLQACVANPLSLLAAKRSSSAAGELGEHIIDHGELLEVNFRWPRFVGKNGRIGDHGQHKKCTVLMLRTKQGAMGWGLSQRNAAEKLDSIKGKTLAQLIAPGRGISAGVPKTVTRIPSSSAIAAVAIPAPRAAVAMMLWPQACPTSGRASYSQQMTTRGPLDPAFASNDVSRPYAG